MSINTKIKGKPESITAAAQWLTGTLAPSVRQAASAAAGARSDDFTGLAADAFGAWAAKASHQADAVNESIGTVADSMQTFATALRGAQHRMTDIRSEASGSGLAVAGFVIQDPGAGPGAPGALPNPGPGAELPAGTEQAHAHAVADYLAWVKKAKAYRKATVEAKKVFVDLTRAAAALDATNASQQQTPAWKDQVDFATGVSSSFAGKQAKSLLDSARRSQRSANFAVHREEAILQHGYSTDDFVDSAKASAARRAAETDAAKVREGRIGKLGVGATSGLTALGIYLDMKNGESLTQAAASNGASAVAGAGGGVLATMGTSMATGAVLGSEVPVLGTAVGALAGAAVGAFTSGAVDSLFEDGNLGHAAVDGLKSVGGTAVSIGGGAIDVGKGAVHVAHDAPGAVVHFIKGIG